MKIKVKDPIIKRVINKIVGRSNVGFKKYGKTLKDDDTNLDGWLNHLQEELMDAVNYIERARVEIKEERDAALYTISMLEHELEDLRNYRTRSELGYGYFDTNKDMTVTTGFSTTCDCTQSHNDKCCKYGN